MCKPTAKLREGMPLDPECLPNVPFAGECCQHKPIPEVGDGLLTEKRIKKIILEHYPCFDEEEEYHIVELEKAIAQAQQALQQGPSLDVVMAEIHKTIDPLSDWGIEIFLNLSKLFSEGKKING